mgnify:CR=1 FL=1
MKAQVWKAMFQTFSEALGIEYPPAVYLMIVLSDNSATNLLVERMRTGLQDRYKKAVAAADFRIDDVAAGREYVEAYVTYIHYVEGVYEAAVKPALLLKRR